MKFRLLVIHVASSWALCQTAPPTVVWQPVITSQDQSLYATFLDNVATEMTDPEGLPKTYTAPTDRTGASDTVCVYPQGDLLNSGEPPWWSNAAGTVDDTGTHQFRPASLLNRTVLEHGVQGIQFLGAFDDGSLTFAPGASLQEAVFFHQEECYSGGGEYGFVRSVLDRTLYFYWGTNANCGIPPLGYCRKYRAGQPDTPSPNPYVLEDDGSANNAVVLPYPGDSVFQYEAYVFWDATAQAYKFRISIRDPSQATTIFETTAQPAAWFPISEFRAADGYVTVTMNKQDPGGVIQYARAPTLQAESVRVGKTGSVGITNAASSSSGGVAAGEIITLYAPNIGPPDLTQGVFDGSDRLASELAGTQVLFDGVAAPLVYTSAHQAAVIVPFSLSGTDTEMRIEYQGNTITSATIPVVAAAPGIFTVNEAGNGAAVALNEDYSINSALHPAARGSYISVYATGGGQMRATPMDGARAPAAPPFSEVLLPVAATVGGLSAHVSYAGAAPNFVEGLLQVNIQIPASVPSGAAIPLIWTVDGVSSPEVTVSIQ